MRDVVFELIQKEYDRQFSGAELIASENFVSKNVLEALGSVLTNKYAEGYPGKRYYGGCEIVDQVEQIAIDRLKSLFGVEYANVQPHSGAQANAAVFLATMQPGDKFMGLDLSHGGHLTHGSPVNYSGKVYVPVFYGVEKETGRIDMDKVAETARRERPKLIVTGASAYPRDWDFKRFREIADEIGAILMADIAHPAGLIATKKLTDPVPHCHIITSTTHKTLRGPRGGIIMIGKDFPNPWGRTTAKGSPIMMSTIINSAVFPGFQGGPLEHVIASKAVSFGEALTQQYSAYIDQVMKNAQAMAGAFVAKNYHLISEGTDNHLMLVDLRSKGLTGKAAENALVKADITINKNMVPFDDQSPFVTSGMRIGTPAVTTRGLKEADCIQLVEWIDHILMDHENETKINTVREEVNQFMKKFPLYPEIG